MGTAFKKDGENITFWSLANDAEVTNYTRFTREDGTEGGFEGCLDYLWGSDNIRVCTAFVWWSDCTAVNEAV